MGPGLRLLDPGCPVVDEAGEVEPLVFVVIFVLIGKAVELRLRVLAEPLLPPVVTLPDGFEHGFRYGYVLPEQLKEPQLELGGNFAPGALGGDSTMPEVGQEGVEAFRVAQGIEVRMRFLPVPRSCSFHRVLGDQGRMFRLRNGVRKDLMVVAGLSGEQAIGVRPGQPRRVEVDVQVVLGNRPALRGDPDGQSLPVDSFTGRRLQRYGDPVHPVGEGQRLYPVHALEVRQVLRRGGFHRQDGLAPIQIGLHDLPVHRFRPVAPRQRPVGDLGVGPCIDDGESLRLPFPYVLQQYGLTQPDGTGEEVDDRIDHLVCQDVTPLAVLVHIGEHREVREESGLLLEVFRSSIPFRKQLEAGLCPLVHPPENVVVAELDLRAGGNRHEPDELPQGTVEVPPQVNRRAVLPDDEQGLDLAQFHGRSVSSLEQHPNGMGR